MRHRRATSAGPDELLAGQARVLEQIVRGEPLPEVLAALCRLVEAEAEAEVRAVILLVDADGKRLRIGAAPSLAELGAATQVLEDPGEVMADTARRLAEHLGVDRCAYAEIEGERVFVITGDHTRGVPSIMGRWEVAAFGPACERAMREGEAYVVEDSEADGRIAEAHRVAYRATLIRAAVCVPLHKGGRLRAAMAVHQQAPRVWTRGEIELVATVVARCWEALERAAAEQALARSRARLEYAVRLSGVGFWYCDLPFAELGWDERVKAHFFLPPEARVTIETFYGRIHPDDRERTRQTVDRAIAEHAQYDVVYRTVEPVTGACKWIRALGGAAYDPCGAPRRFDGVSVDITAQKLEEERLRDQDRRKDEFLATLAHELRNPLAPIGTGLQVLRHEPAQAHRILTMMDRQLGHLVRLVDDLLDLSRITLGKVSLVKERIELRAILDSALEATRPLVEAGGHELALRLPDGPLLLDADATRLAQVFANLVNNAAKYTPRGGRISIEAEARGDRLEVRVRDTGVGIPADMLPRVFDLFTQVGRTIERSQGGLGIGLTLVRRLAELHGGSVEAASAGAGKGSTFTVGLPLAAGGAAAAPREAARRGEGACLKILVVDDNVDAAEMLAMLLEAQGHQARLAHTGPAALEVASELEPDLIFLDIGLPEMNGYEVAARLRADPRLRACMLVALTGWGSEDDRRRAQAAGFDRHLVKPLALDVLQGVLRAARG